MKKWCRLTLSNQYGAEGYKLSRNDSAFIDFPSQITVKWGNGDIERLKIGYRQHRGYVMEMGNEDVVYSQVPVGEFIRGGTKCTVELSNVMVLVDRKDGKLIFPREVE